MFGKAKIIKNQGEKIIKQDRRIKAQKKAIATLLNEMLVDSRIIKQQKERIIDLENNIEFLANNSRNAKIKELRG